MTDPTDSAYRRFVTSASPRFLVSFSFPCFRLRLDVIVDKLVTSADLSSPLLRYFTSYHRVFSDLSERGLGFIVIQTFLV